MSLHLVSAPCMINAVITSRQLPIAAKWRAVMPFCQKEY